MPIPQLTTDLNIISALDPLPNDVTGLSAAEFQAKFDEAANIIKTYLNGLSIYSSSEVDAIVAGVVLGQISDNSLTEIKMANEMKKDIVGGIVSYNAFMDGLFMDIRGTRRLV